MLFSAIVIGGKFRIMYLYFGIQTKKEREVHRHKLIQDYTGLKDFPTGIA